MSQIDLPIGDIDFKKHSIHRNIQKRGTVYGFETLKGETMLHSFHYCTFCGAMLSYLKKTKDGKYEVRAEACNGEIAPIVNRVSFPSGRVAVSDSLHHDSFESIEPVGPPGVYYDYNTFLGQKKYIEAYAEHGVAYGPVLNTCPSLYRDDATGVLTVEAQDWDYEEDAIIPKSGKTELAQIITDLWAYSIMDYEKWLETNPPEEMMEYVKIVNVEPGTYEFTHYASNPFANVYELPILASAELITE